MDIHDGIQPEIQAGIERFVSGMNVAPLDSRTPPAADHDGLIKAGVVPFIRGLEYRYCVMKPVPKRPGLGAPNFQICKGTRMQRLSTGWADMREGAAAAGRKEALIVTALREGIEELGLKLESIGGIWDAGPYDFASARTGIARRMWLFALALHSPGEVLPMEEIAATTAERGWLSLEQFMVVGREDHRYILKDIAERLTSAHP